MKVFVPKLRISFHALGHGTHTYIVPSQALKEEIEEAGDVINISICYPVMENGARRICKIDPMSVPLEFIESKRAHNEPERRTHSIALSRTMFSDKRLLADAVRCLDVISHGCRSFCHPFSGCRGKPQTACQDQRYLHDNSVITRLGIVVKCSQRCVSQSRCITC